jgi:Xaa-Pro aminopeptidase
MWLYNIRGSDIDFNPLAKSYAIVTSDAAHIFIDLCKIPPTAAGENSHLEGVTIHSYEDISMLLGEMARGGVKFLTDNSQLSWKLCDVIDEPSAASQAALSLPSPIALLKSMKNDTELKGVRESHARDGVALTAFLAWLDGHVRGGARPTECEVAEKLEEFRKKMPHWVSPSFATISGYGPNAAIIHYHAQPETCGTLGTDSVYLLDSGAQYLDGTTDVTRTVHFGPVSDRIKMCYSYVLKGHIALASVVFPEGTTGARLDSLARMPLWGAGLDYNHGTGHGVGAFLNVHEGPQGIGFRPRANEAGFCAGMTTSNEPGYYEDGAFGIRIENICITTTANTPNNFANRNFCQFETVTMCPIETTLINFSLMTADEIKWLNSYHETVRETLLPGLTSMFPEALEYMLRKTEAVAIP